MSASTSDPPARRSGVGLWYYPESATFEMYEALLEEGGCNFRDALLLEGPHMRALWLNIERVALARFPDIAQFSTPVADDGVTPRTKYQAFLRRLGYEPSSTAKATFVKHQSRRSVPTASFTSKRGAGPCS